MSKTKFLFLGLGLFFVSLIIFAPQSILASDPPTFEYGADVISETTGLGSQDPIVVATYIINWVLSILGLLALFLIIYSGFIWMIARGNEEEVTKAKNILKAAIIGLIIILVSYSISSYVYNKLIEISSTAASTSEAHFLIKPAFAAEAYEMTDLTFEIGDDLLEEGTGLGAQNPITITSYVINWVLTIFGLLFLILMLYSGYVWMMARGAEEEVTKAKNMIKAAVVGVIVVLASYGISTYIFRVIYDITLT